jgi:hypothetical protein
MQNNMSKYIFATLMLFITVRSFSQDSSKYFYKPFPVYKNEGKLIIAGDVNSFVYPAYYGKDVKKKGYTDPHAKPEYLVYELFRDMKNKDVDGIGTLYDSSFVKADFDPNQMDMLKDYDDIKFRSKFKSGKLTIVRYDFVSTLNKKTYPYFAVVRKIGDDYFLTMNINVTDPFNLVGSYSPNNHLKQKTEIPVNTSHMTPFYFIENDSDATDIYFTNELPHDDYTAVYLAFDFYNKTSTSPEINFLRQLQKTAQIDSAKMIDLLVKADVPLLTDPYFGNYFYAEIKKIFRGYPDVTPLATIKINDGKILYFRFSDAKVSNDDLSNLSNTAESGHISSIIIKEVGGKYYLSLRATNNDVNNVLLNIYMKEAIYDYFLKMK